MFIYFHKKGQSTLEYAIIIAVIVAALIIMQNYIKRSMQGRMKQAADDLGDQYAPANTDGTTFTSLNASSTESTAAGTTTTTSTQTQNRQVSENLAPLGDEVWPQ